MTGRAVLLGHPRSGTTLLRRILGAHREICAPPETHLFGACARFLQSQPTAAGVDMGVLAGLDFAGVGEDEVLSRLRHLAFGLLDAIAAKDNKGQWVEKTAFDSFEARAIERLCQDQVRYLGIIRHPLDVAASCEEFCRDAGTFPAVLHRYICRYPQPAEAFCRSWLDVTESLISLGERRPGQVLICRYEDLTEDPEATVADVLEFLGADPDTSFVGNALSVEGRLGFSDHKSYASTSVHTTSVGRAAAVPPAQLAVLAEFLNPTLELCGYDPLVVEERESTPQLRRRYVHSVAAHVASADSPRV